MTMDGVMFSALRIGDSYKNCSLTYLTISTDLKLRFLSTDVAVTATEAILLPPSLRRFSPDTVTRAGFCRLSDNSFGLS